MKHIQKIITLCTCIIVSCASVSAINISLVEVLDTRSVSVSLSEKENLSLGMQNAEVKVLKDITVDIAQKSIENANIVTITLPEPLQENTTYSLLTLFGAEGSIDFTTGSSLSNNAIENTNPILADEQSIESIVIQDDYTIDILYTTQVSWAEFEYKLLSELKIADIENQSDADARLIVDLEDDIETEKEYILIFLSLMDKNGKDIVFENSIYDFTAPEYIESPSSSSSQTLWDNEGENSIQAKIAARNAIKSQQEQDEDMSGEDIAQALFDVIDSTDMLEEEPELLSAPTDPNLMKDTVSTALSATTTPDTGAATWVLIILTLFINTFYYYSRRKIV